jgi:crotonobetainyl-CoA:carnitine CoA-transferase CaiB-like acyl-CoA transferase
MPLKGLRVLETGVLPAASYCAKMFADFGADVLKIEPVDGDPGRKIAPLVGADSAAAEGAYFGYLNHNKRSAVVDATKASDRAELRSLLAECDVWIDSLDDSGRQALQIDYDECRSRNAGVVIASIDWFGKDGPYRNFHATDATCRALAGLVYGIGPVQGPPIPIPDYQTTPVGGLTAFIAVMAALQRAAPARGRTFHVSLHEAVIALADYNIALTWAAKEVDKRWGVNRFVPNYPLGIFKCKQGWIGITIVTPVQWKTFCNLLGAPELASDPKYVVNRGRLLEADRIDSIIAPWFLTRSAEEWFELGLEHRLPFAVVPGVADLLATPEHRRRGSFVEITHGGTRYEAPRSPLRLTGTPPRLGGAVPAKGSSALQWQAQPRMSASPHPLSDGPKPLTGLRVVDLSMGWAGPHATRHLADLGCDIIKVEACQYPDWWRGVDNRPVVIEQRLYEKSSYFNVLNRNKRDITLDLTTPEGVRLVKDLVRDADAVIENYSNGVLPKLGLDYPSLREVNPGIVMVSMPAFAADGEWRECRAYGSTLEQASGLPSVTGEPSGPPSMNHIAYGDPIGGLNAAAAMLLAVFHRRRTGEGQHIDISQVECMLPHVAPWVIEQSATGRQPVRWGTRHPAFVPHGCFPCTGEDRWILVAIEDDVQWRGLCSAIGRDDLGRDVSLATSAGRRAREVELETAISEWTRARDAEQAMQLLQSAEVSAGVVARPIELLNDPHLLARKYWQWIDRAFVGSHPQPSPNYREGAEPISIVRPAPTLGEHNAEILQGILGLSGDDIERLQRSGIIGNEAVPPNLRKARAATG